MDTPTYTATVVIGGIEQTTLFSALPKPSRQVTNGIVTRQSGKLILTFVDAAGDPFDASALNGLDLKAVPWGTDVAPETLGVGVISGAGLNIYTASWVKDKIPSGWSTFPQDKDGAITLYVELEETGTADYFQTYTRFNVFDGDFKGEGTTLPLVNFKYTWDDAIASEWAKYNRGTPANLDDGVAILAGAGKNDWGTVIDKDLTTSPAGVDNAQYIIAGIGGDWSGFTINDIVRYSLTDLVWYARTPTDGNRVYVADENLAYISDGASWAIDQVTHTGQVTGSTVLSVDATAITDQSTVTAASGDLMLISRAGVLQNVDAVDFNGNMNTSTYDGAGVSEQLVGVSAAQALTNKNVNGVTLATGGSSNQYLSADGNYTTPAGAGDMDTVTYDPAAIGEQLVGLTAVQSMTDKIVNGVNLNSTGLSSAFLNATGSYTTPAGGGNMDTSVYDLLGVSEQLVGESASQNLTNKSVNNVTLVAGGSSVQYLSEDGTYNTPAGAGDMLKAAYDAANINEQLVGLVATQSLTNKTINTVVLDGSGSAALFLTQAGTYVTPAGGGDMVEATYDPAGISEQLVGLVASQSLTNKDVNGVTLNSAGSSVLFLNQSGGYSTPVTAIDDQAIAAGTDNNQTGTGYTLVLTDADNKTVWMNNAGTMTSTIPLNASVAFLTGTKINIVREGAGTLKIVGVTGVTINGVLNGSVDVGTQYQAATLTKRSTDSWVILGDV